MATKICSQCSVERPLTEFWTKTQGGKKYPFYACKTCMKEKRKGVNFYAQRSDASKQANLERIKGQRRSSEHRAKFLCYDAAKADKRRGLENDLDRPFVENLLKEGCCYCKATDVLMTLDRIENDLGHTKKNVVPACYRCNMIRGNMPFAAWKRLSLNIEQVVQEGLFGDWGVAPVARKK